MTRLGRLVVTFLLLLSPACTTDDGTAAGATSGTGGAIGSGGATGSGGAQNTGGVVDAGGSDGARPHDDAGKAPDGATPDDGTIGDGAMDGGGMGDGGPANLAEIVRIGPPTISQKPRPEYGALVVANDGERSYVIESRRDVEPGPYGFPWRTRFRLAAYDAGVEVWAYEADPDDLIGDVVVHPSGDVTLSLERFPPSRMAFDLVRLSRDGSPLGTTTLSEPATIPDSDYGANDIRPLFRMKSDFADATTAGWVRLLADGEGIVAAILSFIDAAPGDVYSTWMALGIATFDWQVSGYVERWARIVDGTHAAQPAAWAYDELRWLQQAIRPFLARDDESGDLLVGRAWNQLRCKANVGTFAEFTAEDCLYAVNPVENERLPLAVTRFDKTGARLGTRVLAPDADAAEQVPFALVAHGGQLVVAGSVVRTLADGSKRLYDNDVFVDYDGYIAVYDAEGQPLRHTDFNLGRGDVLAGMRWTPGGIAAVGAAGWDRWTGGMSISRGANPLFVWLSPDGTRSETRVLPLSDGTRHFNLHDVVVLDQSVIGYGFSDAPMTHSADGGNDAARTFGPLRIRLTVP